ncbi:Minor extracellular protease vpr [Colletotrichum orbiculare MAFF 240422]|uniref:Minor extracellular protease vpr n=1 Tax=Colletotrichum orbiculare (strain 104-T / ATCC 96160 / CBS 514.97 / LARS 414 / MAFF 240422) TaxID=1213857 RepID=N4UW69_COLOR|nr:Minor extracellular protease vpr [Colletotrichum orbiculare MAFF 240422]
MRVVNALVSALVLAGTGAARISRRDVDDVGPSNATVVETNKFILELEQGADKDAIVREIETKGGRVLKVFDSLVFSGIAVESETENTDSLEALVPVVKAWRSTRIPLAPIVAGESYSEDAAGLNYSIHWMTGVDKLHEQGILGKGVKVGVVDTGTEYTHPALGGCFGEGCKVAGGYDFVGDDNYWPFPGEERQPDDDPMDQAGHGTHVAGIIAGQSADLTGVAPEATLYSYKVFGPNEGTGEEVLIEAFLRAFDDGVDIITASVGSTGGWSNNAWALVADRIVQQGVVVTIAAGNSGDVGPFFASSGAAGRHVLAVGSADASIVSARQFAATFALDGVSNRSVLGYRPAEEQFPADIVGWPIVPVTLSINVENDACEPLAEGLNFTGQIPLVRFDEGCEDWERQRWVQERGAAFMLFYLTDRPVLGHSGRGWAQSRWGLLSKDAGEAIVKTVIAGGNVTADFSLDQEHNYVGMYNSGGGKPSVFTSWGGTFDLELKPDITAPGGRILSSYTGGRYRDASGTSMACPYVAGVAALYISAHGGRSVHGAGFATTLHDRIRASGRALPWSVGTTRDFGFWAPPIQVGSGLVDALAVVNATSQLSGETKFALNDTHHFSRYHEVDISNTGATELEYSFEVQDAGGFESYWTAEQAGNPDLIGVPRIKDFVEIEPFKIPAVVSLPSGVFKVGAGETRTAKFSFGIPPGLNATRLPIWSGKILIRASNGDVLSVPYYGIGGSIKHEISDMFYTSMGYPRVASGVNRTLIEEKSSFTFDLSLDAQDFVRLQVALTWGTRELRWDIYEPSYQEREWSYPPVAGRNKYVGSVAAYDVYNNADYPVLDPATYDPNNTFSYPLQYQPRDSPYESWWLGKLADGSRIEPGRYKMRIAALKPFGNPTASDNWQVYQTPEIEVLPSAGGNSSAAVRHRRS